MTLPLPNDPRPADATDGSAAVVRRDREWVMRIRQNEIDAFEAMYRAYKDALGTYVQSLVGTREAAEEVIQDIFTKLWEQRELWDPAGPLNFYLFRAARNRAFNYLRHQRVEAKFRERTLASPSSSSVATLPQTPEETLQLRDIEDAIDRAVDSLPVRCREVFRLNRYHRMSYAEVAKALDISIKTVEMQMGRALSKLRRQLAPWCE